MTTRILVQLSSFRSPEDPDWQRVTETLSQLGATHVTAPQPELPNVAIAVLPEDADVHAVLARLREDPNVANAEPDSWGTTL